MTTGNTSPDKGTIQQASAVPAADSPPHCSADDIYYFREGTSTRLYNWLGAHPCTYALQAGGKPEKGCWFAVWAPNAQAVEVIGDFNGWQHGANPLAVRGDSSGIWEGFVPAASEGDCYKFRIHSAPTGEWLEKGDPIAFSWEEPPRTASRITRLDYDWNDADWMAHRARANAFDAPISIYECHLGSWMRPADNPSGFLNYRDIAPKLADHVLSMGFTHVELMPITEHPFYGSWGYQTTGYFAPTARYGSPQDFMAFIDHLHQRGIGVILDWVPSHFPGDAHGLARFDGTELYEHADRRQGFHPEWNSWIFNYGRHEVRSFLLSSATYWLEKFHIDGIRVDAVASMLYLDYSRQDGQWVPNRHGGHENLEAIQFLRQLNTSIYRDFPDVQMIAEESTAWPGVSRPASWGEHRNDNPEEKTGLGFGMKWNMGWMHDTLSWFQKDPVHRAYHQNALTFGLYYAFNENFVLPLSHDEVVYGKGSLLNKMPGDDWQKFANLRLLYGLMWTHPGKKLLFMGGEFGQWSEWAHESSIDWACPSYYLHAGVQRWLGDLNRLMRSEPALYQLDFEPAGFEWISADDSAQSVLAFLRHGKSPEDTVMVLFNGTPIPRYGYRVGAPSGGRWTELLNSDASAYGGSGVGNHGFVEADEEGLHGRPFSLEVTLPPLGLVVLKPETPVHAAVGAPDATAKAEAPARRPAETDAAPQAEAATDADAAPSPTAADTSGPAGHEEPARVSAVQTALIKAPELPVVPVQTQADTPPAAARSTAPAADGAAPDAAEAPATPAARSSSKAKAGVKASVPKAGRTAKSAQTKAAASPKASRATTETVAPAAAETPAPKAVRTRSTTRAATSKSAGATASSPKAASTKASTGKSSTASSRTRKSLS